MSTDRLKAEEGAAIGAALDGWDTLHYRTIWTCEKWEQDKIDHVLTRMQRKRHPDFQVGRVLHRVGGEEVWRPAADGLPSEYLREAKVDEDELQVVPGNLLLNEGIQEFWDLGIGTAGTTIYNNANADIGVGDSTAAAAATQTDLQAATNKLFKAMVATYPIRTNQTTDFRSDFLTGEANWVWNEWSVRNGNTRNKNLNRKVDSLGTKVSGTWTLTCSITLS